MSNKTKEVTIAAETPPLVLDQKWHELFSKRKTRRMKALEKELGNLLKLQGKLNTEYHEYSQLKKKLLDDIIQDMSGALADTGKSSVDNMGKNKRYIENINKKLATHEKRMTTIPSEIYMTNKKLLEASMAVGYHDIVHSKGKLKKMETEIALHREALKKLMVDKTETEEFQTNLYSYMHDLVGPEIIEQFDKLYVEAKHGD